jgi:hypothetical protein
MMITAGRMRFESCSLFLQRRLLSLVCISFEEPKVSPRTSKTEIFCQLSLFLVHPDVGGFLVRTYYRYGRIYVTPRYLCFQSKPILIDKTKASVFDSRSFIFFSLILKKSPSSQALIPLAEVAEVKKSSGMLYYGLSILTSEREEVTRQTTYHFCCFARLLLNRTGMITFPEILQIFFGFNTHESRNRVYNLVLKGRAAASSQASSVSSTDLPGVLFRQLHGSPSVESSGHHATRKYSVVVEETVLPVPPTGAALPPLAAVGNRTTPLAKLKKMHITILTIGTRGDVQPYIAFGKGLVRDGHTVRVATHTEYGDWIKSHGLEFRSIGGNPAELMELCVNNGIFSVNFLKEAYQRFRTFIDELLRDSYEAVQVSLIDFFLHFFALVNSPNVEEFCFASPPPPSPPTRYERLECIRGWATDRCFGRCP